MPSHKMQFGCDLVPSNNLTKSKLDQVRHTEIVQLAVLLFKCPVTLKSGQGHRNLWEWVELNRGYNHAKLERLCLHSLQKHYCFCQVREHINYLPSYTCQSSIICMVHVFKSPSSPSHLTDPYELPLQSPTVQN